MQVGLNPKLLSVALNARFALRHLCACVLFARFFRVVMAVAFSAMTIGEMSSFAPDYGKARLATNRIFHIHDRESTIDPSSQQGQQPVHRLHSALHIVT